MNTKKLILTSLLLLIPSLSFAGVKPLSSSQTEAVSDGLSYQEVVVTCSSNTSYSTKLQKLDIERDLLSIDQRKLELRKQELELRKQELAISNASSK